MGNNVTSNKCQQPNYVDPDEIRPVASLHTSRTYWNKYCAICNNDSEEIVQWNATMYMRNFVYFVNKHVFEQVLNFAYFFETTARSEGLVYSKPNTVENTRCVRKEKLRKTEFNTSGSELNRFMQKACKQIHSPVFGRSIIGMAYKNVFCYMLGSEVTDTSSNKIPDCNNNNYRDSYSKMTALLNYKHIDIDTSNC